MTINHHNVLVDTLGKKGLLKESLEYVKEEIKEEMRDVATWMSLLCNCRLYLNEEIAKIAGDKIKEIDKLNISCRILLCEIYESLGNKEALEKENEEMKIIRERKGLR